ncbi:hypothetical protein EVAR_35591_1 [Eumeta japonica]|uniref:Uncharacterized protein n=1 Tax=Eumeta variegata TaxID=151549 RepID=A0A4C1XMG5_EUMVA|nr:hypothetical protein EVAR_35591_1 [Eumeta japonica]
MVGHGCLPVVEAPLFMVNPTDIQACPYGALLSNVFRKSPWCKYRPEGDGGEARGCDLGSGKEETLGETGLSRSLNEATPCD